MDTNTEYLCYREVETVEYFKSMGMRYGDANAVT